MNDSLSGLLIILAVIAIQSILALIHAALINASTGQLREMAEDGNDRARQVLALVASTNLAITFRLLTALIYFALAGLTLSNLVDPFLAENPTTNATLVRGVTLLIVACVTFILADIVPEAVGSSYATSLSLAFVGPVRLLMLVLKPIVILLLKSSTLLSSLFRSSTLVNTITEQEIMTLVDAGHTGGTIEVEEKEMIYSVLQLDQTRVSEVMVPRIDVIAVEINQSLEEAGATFIKSGFSRIPVYDDTIDNIKGLLYAKDLLACWSENLDPVETIRDLIRPAYFVPETKRADELLKEIQAQKVHLAIVIDEYGGTAGLVTIENIIEEIIGDIRDEYDIHEEAEYEQHSPGEYTVDASIDLDDFNNMLDVDLPTDDSDTLGGYIYTHFGRVPIVGETIEDDTLIMNILSVDGRRIRKVQIIRKQTENADNGLSDQETEFTQAEQS